MNIIPKKPRRKKIYVWPRVIARHDDGYQKLCINSGQLSPVCVPGDMIEPDDVCLGCGGPVRYQYMGRQYFSMMMRVPSSGAGLEPWFVTGGFEDPADAIIQLSQDLGLTAPRGQA